MTPAKKKTETVTNLPEGQVPAEVKPIKRVSRKAASKPIEVVSVPAKTASKSDAPKAAVESVQPQPWEHRFYSLSLREQTRPL